jgi:glucosylceramidase
MLVPPMRSGISRSLGACAFLLLASCGTTPPVGSLDATTQPYPLADASRASPPPILHVWLTTRDLTSRVARQADLTPTAPALRPGDLTFDMTAALQTVDGFGAAMTDTSAYLLETGLAAPARARVMADLFSRPAGIGLSLMRVPMGSSDFTACSCTYSYDDGAGSNAAPTADAAPESGAFAGAADSSADSDAPGDAARGASGPDAVEGAPSPASPSPDPTLAAFTTAHDDAYVIPALRLAQSLNPSLEVFANPWSPPAWMKTNASMLGTANGGPGTLLPAAADPLARYFVRFVEDYRAKGVSLWGITPQNEPSVAPDSYSGMAWSASDEATFIADHLAPALADAGLGDVKILGGDDSGASLPFAQALFANARAASALYATAWHCYGGLGDMTAIHAARPDLPLYMTECSTGPMGIAGDATAQVLTAMANWASGAVLWNLALDTAGGPKMGVGCVGCSGLVTVDANAGTYDYTINYYELAQFSKFVAPGAKHVARAGGNGVSAEGFRNPDGTVVVVAYNAGTDDQALTFGWPDGRAFRYLLPSEATVTFTSSAVGVSDAGM